MSRKKLFFLYMAFSFVLTSEFSCVRNSSLSEKISALKKARIHINTENLTKVTDHIDKKCAKHSRYTYVMYVDSMSCSLCTLKEMNKWTRYMEEMSAFNINFMPVFKPMKRDLPEFVYRVKAMNLPFTVYIDSLGVLEEDNTSLRDLGDWNTFIIDKEGQIIIVGNPIRNHGIKEMVKEYLQLSRCSKLFYSIEVSRSHICRTLSRSYFPSV